MRSMGVLGPRHRNHLGLDYKALLDGLAKRLATGIPMDIGAILVYGGESDDRAYVAERVRENLHTFGRENLHVSELDTAPEGRERKNYYLMDLGSYLEDMKKHLERQGTNPPWINQAAF